MCPKKLKLILFVCLSFVAITPARADFNLYKVASGLIKAAKAVTLTDQQVISYVKEYIEYMDKQNTVLPASSSYTKRLKKLTTGITEVDGLPLNFKVYKVDDVNAFACADGSIRVFSSLMDLMTDDELLGVIGHEIGHVANKHSKKAFRTALLTSALRDGVSSTSGTLAALADSQLGSLSETLVSAKYSRNQEREADDYGYEFLKSHGKNPLAMSKSFRKLKQIQESSGIGTTNKINQLFSSHPDLDSRIERMEQRARAEGLK